MEEDGSTEAKCSPTSPLLQRSKQRDGACLLPRSVVPQSPWSQRRLAAELLHRPSRRCKPRVSGIVAFPVSWPFRGGTAPRQRPRMGQWEAREYSREHTGRERMPGKESTRSRGSWWIWACCPKPSKATSTLWKCSLPIEGPPRLSFYHVNHRIRQEPEVQPSARMSVLAFGLVDRKRCNGRTDTIIFPGFSTESCCGVSDDSCLSSMSTGWAKGKATAYPAYSRIHVDV